ncbi:hypothetical protein MJ560_13370 [Klebsiella pneumoniae]|nr:hypothetical protein MJ560_13370 [Klebsiella pneumoniae]
MTFGLKLAGTLDALPRWQQRLREMRPRPLALQFDGAAGTLDALKEKGPAVGLALAQILGPVAAGLLRCGNAASAIGCWRRAPGSLASAARWGKFANDFSLLMQTEVAEIGEPVAEGRGGSSTMPRISAIRWPARRS